jgi:actin-related protein
VVYGYSLNNEPFQAVSCGGVEFEKTLNEFSFEQLKNSLDEHSFFYVDGFELNKNKRELISEILFESYNVPDIIYGFSPILSGLYAYIKREIDSLEITACVVELSDSCVKMAPIVTKFVHK